MLKSTAGILIGLTAVIIAIILLLPPPNTAPQKTPPPDENKLETAPQNMAVQLPAPPPLPAPVAKPVPVAKPALASAPAPMLAAPQAQSIVANLTQPTPAQAQKADKLLQQWEQGSGATIQIQWPSKPAQRKALYNALHCLGVRSGLLASDGSWLIGEGNTTYNPTRHSAMVRVSQGAISVAEQNVLSALRSKASQGVSNARLFPRYLDARLLAGLQQLQLNTKAGSISGQYVLSNNTLAIEAITSNNKPTQGKIALAQLGQCKIT